MNGGYVLIDLGGLNLSSESEQTIDGLYARLDEIKGKGKFALAENAVGASPIPAIITVDESDNIVLTAPGYIITVADDDGVTVTPGGGGNVKKKPELSNLTYTGGAGGIVSITPAFDPATPSYLLTFDSSSGMDALTFTADDGVSLSLDDCSGGSPSTGTKTLTANINADNMGKPYILTLSDTNGATVYVFKTIYN